MVTYIRGREVYVTCAISRSAINLSRRFLAPDLFLGRKDSTKQEGVNQHALNFLECDAIQTSRLIVIRNYAVGLSD